MRILHVIGSIAPNFGGPSQAIIGMCSELVKLGHEVEIYTTSFGYSQAEKKVLDNSIEVKKGIKIHYFHSPFLGRMGHSNEMIMKLKSTIKDFDIVHSHSLYMTYNYICSKECRKNKIPHIVRPHGTLDPFIYKKNRVIKSMVENLYERRVWRNADALHYTTREEKDLAVPFVGHERGFIVPNGVYLEDYQKAKDWKDILSKYPELENKRLIIFFGRINYKKGIDILLEAFLKLLNIREDVHLLIVGPENDGYKDKLLLKFKSEELWNKVTFTGMVLGEEKNAFLQNADVFVLPSHSENFGISVIESMISKTAVIISNKVNLHTDISENNAGLVTNCDSNEIFNAINELLNNYGVKLILEKNGYELVLNKYLWSSVGKELEKNYYDLLDKRNKDGK